MARPILHVVGARPQFVKVAAVLRAARAPGRHAIVHTGQHYDPGLSQVFFDELDIPPPAAHLGLGGGSHGAQTGAMLVALEAHLLASVPGVVVVYGDTNSTLAAALAAAKLHWPVVHVEAGLRSFDRRMPEELNRIATDHLSDLLLCPTRGAVDQLAREGLSDRARLVGDVMLDIALRERPRIEAARPPEVPSRFYLATIHRAGNTDDPTVLERLVQALGDLDHPVVWPVHPRARQAMARAGLPVPARLQLLDPLGYLEFASLLSRAEAVLTDSGGVQKEAYFAGRRCVTLRDTTEWVETLTGGWNVLAGDDPGALRAALAGPGPTAPPDLSLYGGGRAAARCVEVIEGV